MDNIITIPDGWHEITISKFQELAEVESTGREKSIEIISILTDIEEDLIKGLGMSTMGQILTGLTWSNETPADALYKPIISAHGLEFGLIPKFENLTYGQWSDLEHYIEKPIANLHNIMAILYSPLVTAFNDRDRIVQDYDANYHEAYSTIFKNEVMISDVYGVLVFFCLIAQTYTSVTQDYLEEQMKLMKK